MALVYLFSGISIFCIITFIVMEIYFRYFEKNDNE